MDVEDVGVGERRDRPRFPLEALARTLARRPVGPHDFDRDIAIEPGIPGAIDFAHPPRSQGADNLVRPQPCS